MRKVLGNASNDLPPSESCDACSSEMALLQDTIVSMQKERHCLQEQLAHRRRETALMRNALMLCRQVIEGYHDEGKLADRSKTKQPQSASLRWAFFRRSNNLVSIEWGIPRKSNIPRYIAPSALEFMIIRTATLKVSGILGVIIEANRKPGRVSGANWHIAGIINGKADPSAAAEAVKQAANRYACWVVVEEHSRLKGRAIARTVELTTQLEINSASKPAGDAIGESPSGQALSSRDRHIPERCEIWSGRAT